MLRILCLCGFVAFCQGYGVGSSVHTVAAPIAVPYVSHGYGGHLYSGYGYGIGGYGVGHELGHGLGHGFGHGFIKPVLHHILKRSPHYVHPSPQAGHVPIIAVAAPFAVSHQARVDVHSAPAIVKQIVTPFVQAAPVYHGSFGHYGDVNGPFHPHVGHF